MCGVFGSVGFLCSVLEQGLLGGYAVTLSAAIQWQTWHVHSHAHTLIRQLACTMATLNLYTTAASTSLSLNKVEPGRSSGTVKAKGTSKHPTGKTPGPGAAKGSLA